MPEGYHPPLEEYLEAIHDIEEEGVTVIQARLTERLEHSPPTVSEMVHRLQEGGYITIEGRAIRLTDAGRNRAESVVRKHRLAERLLVDIIGMEWHKSHDEATRWEHVISDEVEQKLIALLGNPQTCPHGNPIPGAGGDDGSLRRLSEASVGDDVTMRRVTEQVEFTPEWLTFLGENGFTPGVVGHVTNKDARGNLTVTVNEKELPIPAALAQLLFVAA
jgi:DtxR family transcriptional regulator, Mn-dependent transcriptional regulator